LTCWAAAAALLLPLVLGGSSVLAGPLGLVDDLNDASLAEYTLTKVLDQNAGTSNVSFSSPSGDLRVSSAGTTGAEQVLFLRNDHTLAVGESLRADVHGFAGWDRDIGIAVSIASPTGLGNPAAGDVRAGYVEVSFRSNNQVVSYANDTGSQTSGQEFAGSNYGGDSFNTTDRLVLFIDRLTTNDFEVGWLQGGTRHVLTANGGSFAPYTLTTNVPGAEVGFYADVRADLSSSPVGLDDLRIVPEPATLALGGFALIGLLVTRRRHL
jgi:PEP-CTERM motif